MFSYISIIFAVANDVCVLFCFVFVRQTVGELLMDMEKQMMDSQNTAFTSELLQFFQMVKIKCLCFSDVYFHYNFQTNPFVLTLIQEIGKMTLGLKKNLFEIFCIFVIF